MANSKQIAQALAVEVCKMHGLDPKHAKEYVTAFEDLIGRYYINQVFDRWVAGSYEFQDD